MSKKCVKCGEKDVPHREDIYCEECRGMLDEAIRQRDQNQRIAASLREIIDVSLRELGMVPGNVGDLATALAPRIEAKIHEYNAAVAETMKLNARFIRAKPGFQVGDVVQLKSGGPPMTVVEMMPTVNGELCPAVKWLGVGGIPQWETFPAATLRSFDSKSSESISDRFWNELVALRKDVQELKAVVTGAAVPTPGTFSATCAACRKDFRASETNPAHDLRGQLLCVECAPGHAVGLKICPGCSRRAAAPDGEKHKCRECGFIFPAGNRDFSSAPKAGVYRTELTADQTDKPLISSEPDRPDGSPGIKRGDLVYIAPDGTVKRSKPYVIGVDPGHPDGDKSVPDVWPKKQFVPSFEKSGKLQIGIVSQDPDFKVNHYIKVNADSIEPCPACDGEGSLSTQMAVTSMEKCGGSRKIIQRNGETFTIYIDAQGREIPFKTIGGPCMACWGSKIKTAVPETPEESIGDAQMRFFKGEK